MPLRRIGNFVRSRERSRSVQVSQWVGQNRLTGNGCSGGDQEFAFGGDEALVAVGAVAVADVVGHGLGQGVPAVVVGVVDDELADAPEVALDAVQKLA